MIRGRDAEREREREHEAAGGFVFKESRSRGKKRSFSTKTPRSSHNSKERKKKREEKHFGCFPPPLSLHLFVLPSLRAPRPSLCEEQTAEPLALNRILFKMARSSSTARLVLLVVAAVAAVATLMPTAALAAPSPADNAVFTNYIIPNDVDGKPVSG